MKSLLTIILIVFSTSGFNDNLSWDGKIPTMNSLNEGAIKWEEVVHDLGEIEQNIPVSVDFKFQNLGEIPLLISDVKASCGCTTTYFPKEPIAPGAWTKVTASYNAKKLGAFSKTVTVTTNLEDTPKQLMIKGVVVE
jgi:hypothetical protein